MFNPSVKLYIRRQPTPHSTSRSGGKSECEFTLKHEHSGSDDWAVGKEFEYEGGGDLAVSERLERGGIVKERSE